MDMSESKTGFRRHGHAILSARAAAANLANCYILNKKRVLQLHRMHSAFTYSWTGKRGRALDHHIWTKHIKAVRL